MLVQGYGREVVIREYGLNASRKERRQPRISHVQVGHRQAKPRNDRGNAGTRSRTVSKIDCREIGHWTQCMLSLNAGTRSRTVSKIDCREIGHWTQCMLSFAMIWGSGRFAPDLCHISSQTSRKQLMISFPCVTRIYCFCEPPSWEMRPSANSSMGNQSGNR
ncbi:hypothetical protein QE152_g38099 [Popillia japonica]|uniref:Uncharacterized protein n=1 Tax=Popillia japonica TaxID=7064 RepID=A0AAW1I8X4_POPJA